MNLMDTAVYHFYFLSQAEENQCQSQFLAHRVC